MLAMKLRMCGQDSQTMTIAITIAIAPIGEERNRAVHLTIR